MSRSFTIEKITKTTGGNTVRYDGGRFIGETPSGAAKKAFSKAYHHLNAKGPMSLKIKIRETTQGSLHKMYTYRVTKKSDVTTVERDGQEITYRFSTKIKSV